MIVLRQTQSPDIIEEPSVIQSDLGNPMAVIRENEPPSPFHYGLLLDGANCDPTLAISDVG